MKKMKDPYNTYITNPLFKAIKPITLLLFVLLANAFFIASCEDVQSKDNNLRAALPSEIEHGKYLIEIAGCNDCHTIGYAENSANVPEEQWLTGSPVGFKGPWGTSYAGNLRLFVNNISEDQWIEMARTRNGMPPMPWVSLKSMNKKDLSAIYNFIKKLGPAGKMAPTYVGPNQEPKTPYIIFEPVHMERLSSVKN